MTHITPKKLLSSSTIQLLGSREDYRTVQEYMDLYNDLHEEDVAKLHIKVCKEYFTNKCSPKFQRFTGDNPEYGNSPLILSFFYHFVTLNNLTGK